MMRTIAIGWLVLLFVLRAEGGAGQTIELDGVKFTSEHEGMRLITAWGEGSTRNPFVVVEEIIGPGAAILTIEDLGTNFGDDRSVHHGLGFRMVKVVRNRTSLPWPIFELELRETLDEFSDYGDGLSFGQATHEYLNFRSDRYTMIDAVEEPADAVRFSGAVVPPGETVSIEIAVTDYTPRRRFFLIQRRDAPLASLAPAIRAR